MSTQRHNVLVVGGGGAGAFIALRLSSKLDRSKYRLILINARPYFAHIIAAVRMVVTTEGNLEENALVPFDRAFASGTCDLVVGEVVTIMDQGDQGGHVTLSSGESLNYSVLVLATGSLWDGPLQLPDSKAETKTWVDGWRGKFEKSNDILLVGGGAVAVGECCSSITVAISDENRYRICRRNQGSLACKPYRVYHKVLHSVDTSLTQEKKVTIIHSQKLLLNDVYPDKWRLDVEHKLRSVGVEFILGDKVEGDLSHHTGGPIVTRNGQTLSPDLVVSHHGLDVIQFVHPDVIIDTHPRDATQYILHQCISG